VTRSDSLAFYERQRFVDDLIGFMTLDEKLGQLNIARSAQEPGLEAGIAAGRVGGVVGSDTPQRLQTLATDHSRLGIPLLLTAVSPPRMPLSPWALAASWDEDLARHLGGAIAEETLRSGANCLLAVPVAVTAGPDAEEGALVAAGMAHLAARLAAAFARGAGGNHNELSQGVLAIPAVAGPELSALRCGLELARGHDVLGLDCSPLDRETALNAGYTGLLLSECRRLAAILAKHFATTSARSQVEAAEKAMVDGLIGEHEIEGAVRGVLAVKHALGLFRRGGRPLAEAIADRSVPSPAEVARRSMVLLRNESGLLPFSPVSDRVLVVGAEDGAGGACADALSRAGIGHSVAPGLALRRGDEVWADPVAGDHLALSLTRDASQRADFVLMALDERHFSSSGQGKWQQPSAAVMNLLRALSTTGKRLAAVVASREPVDLAAADQHFAAVLHCWGMGAGFAEALADVLSGRNSPQGRLPVTAGRFEFGQGLGYSENVFSGLAVAAGHDHIAASVRVRNSGSFAARETVQAYLRDKTGQFRLIGFEHVSLAPGEEIQVRFEFGLDQLGELGATHRLEVSAGRREIFVGKNLGRLLSAEVDISTSLARAIRHQNAVGLRVAV
jgi:beta-glucosidase